MVKVIEEKIGVPKTGLVLTLKDRAQTADYDPETLPSVAIPPLTRARIGEALAEMEEIPVEVISIKNEQ